MSDAVLDAPEQYGHLDPSDMYRLIASLPQQMEDAWKRAGEVELPDTLRNVRNVILAGVGGSAVGGSLLEGYGADTLSLPFSVWRGYGLPAYAGKDTLLVAVSYSGNTEETISALLEGRERGCRLLAITTNGEVGEFANTWQISMMTFPYDAPRTTLGYLFTPLVRIFARLGFLPAQDGEFDEALRVARDAEAAWGGERPVASNLAKEIATEAQGRAVVVYGGEYLAAVARRWKAVLNENAKSWAFWEEFPELNHNAIAGYQYPADFLEHVLVLTLTGSHLSERVRRRTQATQHLLDEFKVPSRHIEPKGEGKLAQIFSHIALGEYVSYYLALLNGADPMTVAPITSLKASLAQAENEAGVPPLDEPGVRPGLTIPKAPEG